MQNILTEQMARIGIPTTCPVAVIVKDSKILMGHRHYSAETWKKISVWTCPGGRCNLGETLEETLRREVAEETGITDLEIMDFIGEVPGAKEGDTVPLFYCETSQDPQLMEPDKFSEWKWVEVEEYATGWPGTHINNPARAVVTEYLRSK